MNICGGGGGRCPVCFGGMGHGQAVFTAECSHAFHLRCVPRALFCPVCSARWRDAPSSVQPPHVGFYYGDDEPPMYTLTPPPDTGSLYYDDDEPPFVEPLTPPPPQHAQLGLSSRNAAAAGASSGVLVLKAHCEYPAVPLGEARDGFAVLVHAKAPAAAAAAAAGAEEEDRAPLDLVTVLDVSGSMGGSKLELVKRAMGFVVDSLGPRDRLSVVAFSGDARRVLPLTRMTEGGKALAKRAVDELRALDSTNTRAGLDVAARVLGERRHANSVASVILLSDGQDNHYGNTRIRGGFRRGGLHATFDRSVLVPPSLARGAGGGRGCAPVHAFGFGTDHDAAAMHAISEATGGTFSFVEDHAAVQDSFAQCVGGLLSVAVQRALISVECLHPDVRVRAVKSGRYGSCLDAEGRAATVDVGELYADEERRLLVFLDVPRARPGDNLTSLVAVRCAYRDTATGQTVEVSCQDACIERPPLVAPDVAPCLEVARERARVEAAEDIERARAAAERGAYAEAARILDARREALAASAPALAGDAACAALADELRELGRRVADEREYAETGRACLLAGMSSHAQQRASSVRLSDPRGNAAFGASRASSFATPAMRRMGKRSEVSRGQEETRQQPPAAVPETENASRVAVPRSRLEARLASVVPRFGGMLRKYPRIVRLRR